MKAILLGAVLFSASLFADSEITNIKQVGVHHRVLTFEKSRNPQNTMIVYTKLDSDCKFLVKNNKPVFDFYWMMNRKKYKPVHRLIISGIRERLTVRSVSTGAEEMIVDINDLKEMKHDLQDPTLVIKARVNAQQKCEVESFVRLGPSDGGRVVQLDSIYAKVRGLIRPTPVAITLRGKDVNTGESISRIYSAK